ncbi:MAG: hypothetical protein SH850_03130 [Planctomycetaceae bacterium]|nr:hypothetical protein [Planctomycetaceae bacterium]
MAVSVGLLCVGLFVMLLMAASIATLVVFIKWISGPTEPRPASSAAGVKAFIGAGALGFIGLLCLAMMFFVGYSRVEHVQTATPVWERPAETMRQHSADIEDHIRRRVEEATREAMNRPTVTVAPESPATPKLPETPSTMLPALPMAPVSAVEDIALAPAPVAAFTPAVAPVPAEPPTADRTTVDPTSPAGPPAWIKSGAQTVGESQFLVISSKQYATRAEAENDAGRQVMALLREDLRKYTSQTWVRPNEVIGLPESLGLAVRDTYVETASRDFGSFFAPMHRVWYRVELSPAVREPALMRWRAALATSRMATAGGGFLALLCVPLAVVGFGCCNRWTHGKARTPLAFGMTAAVLAVWVAGGLMFARLFVLWG